MTIGVESNAIGATESAVQVVPATTAWADNFNAGGDIEMEGEFGDGWFVTWDENAGTFTNGLAGDDNKVLIGQFTTNGILSGEIFVQMFPEGDQQNPIQVFLPFGCSDDADAQSSRTCLLMLHRVVPMPIHLKWLVIDEGCIAEVDLTLEETMEAADCGYTLTRTWTATDAWGNTATATQVVNLEDTEAPVAVAQEDLTVECGTDLTPGSGVAEYPVNSFDNCAVEDLTWEYTDVEMAGGADLTGVTADFLVEMGGILEVRLANRCSSRHKGSPSVMAWKLITKTCLRILLVTAAQLPWTSRVDLSTLSLTERTGSHLNTIMPSSLSPICRLITWRA